MPPAKLPNVNTVTLLGRIAGTRAKSGTRGSNGVQAGLLRMRPKIRPYHLFYRPAPGQHICIPCSEKEDPEEEKKTAADED